MLDERAYTDKSILTRYKINEIIIREKLLFEKKKVKLFVLQEGQMFVIDRIKRDN